MTPFLIESARALIEHHRSHPEQTSICFAPTELMCQTLAADARFLWEVYYKQLPLAIEIFPAFKYHAGMTTETSSTVPAFRNRVLYRHILTDPKPIILTTLGAFSARVPGENQIDRYCFDMSVGDNMSVDRLSTLCAEMGYEPQDIVDEVGTYAPRGFVLDVFSPAEQKPIRVEFLDDQIERMYTFDLYTQRTARELSSAVIIAPRFFHYGGLKALDEMERRINQIPIPLNRKYQMIDALRARQWWPEADLIELASAGDFVFPELFFKDARLYVTDRDACARTFEPPIAPDAEPHYLPISRSPHWSGFRHTAEETLAALDACRPISLSDTDAVSSLDAWALSEKDRRDFFSTWMPHWLKQGGRVYLSAQSHLHLQKCLKHIEDHDIPPSAITLESMPLSQSFVDPVKKIAGIRSRDLFAGPSYIDIDEHAKIKHFFSTLKTLSRNDYVIHTDHGMCRYLGLQRITAGETAAEYLALEFDHKDKLFVPIYRLHLIQKYAADKSAVIALDSLREQKFQKRKRKIQEHITHFAHEIIELQARRELARTQGISRVEGEEEFADSFPYDETKDQLVCIQEVLKDLEKKTPMDRLLCGDVGFGKTEVAFRAIFRVLKHQKQAVFLAPTTLLAQQHYLTAQTRFKGYPFRFGVLSRFQTPAAQRQTLEALRGGLLDCVIGTHRLLQKDVEFADLSLVVIDEEHKFGVKQKELFKRMRVHTHTLSLSATPIPRSLNQTLTGIRSLSILITPPTNRLPIHTALARPDPSVLRAALQRETARSGQVFCVVPRVQDIPEVETWLNRHAPDIAYGVAHGQMNERELEKIMIAFYGGAFPILIATNIIESGLDVPTANTMFVFKAHMFGLAQLYQLRGRIGRSHQQAYCYLLRPQRKEISERSEKRLQILLRYNELGSGFQVAQYDLEVRGAGNILGEKQSGFIHEVGAEFYFDMLRNTVKQLQGSSETHVDPEINWSWETLIPERYLSSIALRLEMYQSLSNTNDPDKLYQTLDEIENRFGPIPPPVTHLILLHLIRLICRRLGIRHLRVHPNRLDIVFINTPPIDMKHMIAFFENQRLKFTFRSSHQLSLVIAFSHPQAVKNFMAAFADAAGPSEINPPVITGP